LRQKFASYVRAIVFIGRALLWLPMHRPKRRALMSKVPGAANNRVEPAIRFGIKLKT